MQDDLLQSDELSCPGCGELLQIDASDAGTLTRCPYCSTQFFASPDNAALAVVDDTDPSLAMAANQDELDGLRIRKLAALRRGAIRARSWCWIAAVVAVVAAIQLLFKALQNIRYYHTVSARAVGFVLFAGLCVYLAAVMFQNGRRLNDEIHAPSLPPPAAEPDFTSLSDGRQQWQNLHDIR